MSSACIAVKSPIASGSCAATIFLEPAGRQTLDHLFAILDHSEHAVLRALSSSELLTLNRTLDRIYAQIFADD
jgi:hypothetical protein